MQKRLGASAHLGAAPVAARVSGRARWRIRVTARLTH